MLTDDDLLLMQDAMLLAQKGEGMVNPNPLVGALVVKDDEVIAQGYHARYGGLHAERMAFRDADERNADCKGTTMYVTLEPCCHEGQQPPCTDAIIERGISRVVVGLNDPNPLVAGKGIANPLATVWSASQMLDFFGHENWGARLIDCIEELLVENTTLTPDLGGSASTCEVGDAIVRMMQEKYQ